MPRMGIIVAVAVGAGSLVDARGITDDVRTKGTCRSTLHELAEWTLRADQVVTL